MILKPIALRPLLGLTAWCTISLLALGAASQERTQRIYLVVLGIAQDGGVPQAGTKSAPDWRPPEFRRLATSLALVDETEGRRFLFEATPDFREQLARLDALAPVPGTPGLDGIFLTHAHMGHYTGLIFLGHESMGARNVPVYAMPRMARYLRTNGPWSQLVGYQNIDLRELSTQRAVELGRVSVSAFPVPHRQEFSEVVGFRVDGPERSALFLPDIDSWDDWDALGVRLEDQLRSVDIAFLDATFFADGEVPGRDMSGFPHPRIRDTMERLAPLPAEERAKVRLIHLNHTNPALVAGTPQRQELEAAGLRVAEEGEIFDL
ncbi:MAG: MBL fold metallo-hydrolase [Thermoanaerobaculia bacterium]|nr:MBL fold metallo-hydrolase [Thermoanaerobaculia bacterium]